MGEKGEREFVIDVKDVVRGSIVLQDGKLVWPPSALEVPAPNSPPKPKGIVKPPELQSPFSAEACEIAIGASQYYYGVTCECTYTHVPSDNCFHGSSFPKSVNKINYNNSF